MKDCLVNACTVVLYLKLIKFLNQKCCDHVEPDDAMPNLPPFPLALLYLSCSPRSPYPLAADRVAGLLDSLVMEGSGGAAALTDCTVRT